MSLQLDSRLREALERLTPGDLSDAGGPSKLEVMLQQLLSVAQAQTSRLAKMEASCFTGGVTAKTGFQLPERGAAGHQEQEVDSRSTALDDVLAALQQTRAGLDAALMSLRQRHLPAGKTSYKQKTLSSLVFTLPNRQTQQGTRRSVEWTGLHCV